MTSSWGNGLLEAMRAIEALPAAASGALLVGQAQQPSGMIFVESNRICWAAAAGLHGRLRDLLRQAGDHDHRAAIKQHTVESLLALEDAFGGGDVGWPITWQEHSAETPLSPPFTFAAAELLAAIGAHVLDGTSAELIDDHLDSLDGSEGALIAFDAVGEGDPWLVAVRDHTWLPLDDLFDLARWAAAALEASPGFSPAMTHACAHSSDGGTLAWSYEGHRYAAICPNRRALQRLVTMLDNWSLAMVLATRSSVLQRVRERAALSAG